MRIDVTGRQFEITPAIEAYAEEKCEKLPRYYDGVQQIFVVLEQPKQNHFEVELRVESEKHDTFVAKSDGPDLYPCVDTAIDKMVRQLTDFKEKLKNSKR